LQNVAKGFIQAISKNESIEKLIESLEKSLVQ
jgi:hypothetical protein